MKSSFGGVGCCYFTTLLKQLTRTVCIFPLNGIEVLQVVVDEAHKLIYEGYGHIETVNVVEYGTTLADIL